MIICMYIDLPPGFRDDDLLIATNKPGVKTPPNRRLSFELEINDALIHDVDGEADAGEVEWQPDEETQP